MLSPSRISSPSTFSLIHQQDRGLKETGGERGAFAANLGLLDMEIMHGFNSNMNMNCNISSSSSSSNNSNSTNKRSCNRGVATQGEEDMDLRRGPWTVEEDLMLVNYINANGEGRWNSLARSAGLKRTGKSCRLRWLNYLRPDVRRGNITPEEQLLILELHSRWGNRWSKIAQHLPGRTDNEVKNYWRTRVQKHAKQLQCDVNSKQFKDVMRYLWMPRLAERIRHANSTSAATGLAMASGNEYVNAAKTSPENSSSMVGCSSDSMVTQQLSPAPASDFTGMSYAAGAVGGGDVSWCGEFQAATSTAMVELGGCQPESLPSPCGFFGQGLPEMEQSMWGGAGGEMPDSFWGLDDDFWSLQQQQQQLFW